MTDQLIHNLFNHELGFSVYKYRHIDCHPGFTYAAHEHEHIEINYVQKGACHMDFNGQIEHFETGDTMVVYPGAQHDFAVDNRLGCHIVQVEFRINNLSVLEYRKDSDDNLLFLFSLLQHGHRYLKIPGNSDINDNMVRLVKELDTSTDANTPLVKLYFFELFIHLSRNLKIEKDLILSKPDQYVVKALQYLHNNFLQDPSVEEIANYCAISDRYLRKLFFKQTGEQIVEYKHKLRMQMAAELLKDPGQRLTDIAYRCGYQTQQYFNKVFKDFYGQTPGDFRRSFRSYRTGDRH